MKDSGVDLSLLTKVLVPQDAVMEVDEPWEFDALFVKVTSELQLELEQEEELKKRDEDTEDPDNNNINK